MRNIERLLARARNIHCVTGRYIVAFVDYDPAKGCYTASCNVWDGVKGSGGENHYSEHNTSEAAVNACKALLAQHPGAESIRLYLNDIPLQDGGDET